MYKTKGFLLHIRRLLAIIQDSDGISERMTTLQRFYHICFTYDDLFTRFLHVFTLFSKIKLTKETFSLFSKIKLTKDSFR
jgi:hypothetical protein